MDHKRDIFSQLLHPSPIIRESKAQKRSEIVLKERKALTQRERLIKACNTTVNKRWPDGRIYSHQEDGENISHSVSPYADTFLNNIEDKLVPLILALKKKGYMSTSSCEGHDMHEPRFVMLVFPSEQTALDFVNRLPINLKYNLKNIMDVLNMSVDTDKYGRISEVRKQDIMRNQHSSAMEYINVFLRRNYRDAWMLELIILEQVPVEKNLFGYLKHWKKIIKRVLLSEYLTHRLTKFIASEKMPHNLY